VVAMVVVVKDAAVVVERRSEQLALGEVAETPGVGFK